MPRLEMPHFQMRRWITVASEPGFFLIFIPAATSNSKSEERLQGLDAVHHFLDHYDCLT